MQFSRQELAPEWVGPVCALTRMSWSWCSCCPARRPECLSRFATWPEQGRPRKAAAHRPGLARPRRRRRDGPVAVIRNLLEGRARWPPGSLAQWLFGLHGGNASAPRPSGGALAGTKLRRCGGAGHRATGFGPLPPPPSCPSSVPAPGGGGGCRGRDGLRAEVFPPDLHRCSLLAG